MPQQYVNSNGREPGPSAGAASFADAPEPTEEIDSEPTTELAAADEIEDERGAVPVGEVFADRYLVEGRLGTGGTATILRARDLYGAGGRIDGGRIAIKTLRPELRFRASSVARLQREFRQTCLVGHPSVVRQFGIGCDKGRWYIAMELLNGEPLGRRLRDQRPNGLPMTEALQIAAVCGDVLACAHDKGVTHGDVKPDNVLVTDQGVRMIDFGTAPSPQGSAAQPPAVTVAPAATRPYASPEVLAGLKPEPSDDVFSLACVIYEMLAGRHPYSRLGADEARNLGMRIEPIPGLNPEQWRALSAGLAWARDARPADVRDLLREFAPQASPAVTPAQPEPPTPVPQPAVAMPAAAPVLPQPNIVMPGAAAVRPQPRVVLPAVMPVMTLPMTPLRVRGPEVSRRSRRFRPMVGLAAVVAVMGLFAIFGGGWLSSPPPAPAIVARIAPAPRVVEPPPAVIAPAPPVAQARVAPSPPLPRASFKDAEMIVSRGTVSAAIPIQLQAGAARARVAWRTIDGSAVAGRDYGGPRSGVAQFQERQTDRILYVPIVTDASSMGDRSFTVELTGVPSGARLGSPRRIVVTIQGGGLVEVSGSGATASAAGP